MTTPDALGAQRGERLRASLALIGSATPSRPAEPAVDRDEHDALRPRARSASAAAASGAGSIAELVQQRGVAERDAPAVDRAA